MFKRDNLIIDLLVWTPLPCVDENFLPIPLGNPMMTRLILTIPFKKSLLMLDPTTKHVHNLLHKKQWGLFTERISFICYHEFNMADPQRNLCIGKVFELAEPHFRRNMKHNFFIKAVIPYHDRNRNRDRKCILNPCFLYKLKLKKYALLAYFDSNQSLHMYRDIKRTTTTFTTNGSLFF